MRGVHAHVYTLPALVNACGGLAACVYNFMLDPFIYIFAPETAAHSFPEHVLSSLYTNIEELKRA